MMKYNILLAFKQRGEKMRQMEIFNNFYQAGVIFDEQCNIIVLK